MCCSRCSVELWVVQLDGLHTDWDELAYQVVFVVASGATPGPVHSCKMGQTLFHVKEPITRQWAAEVHRELVRRAEAELTMLD